MTLRVIKFIKNAQPQTSGVKRDRLVKLFNRLEKSMNIIVDQMDYNHGEDQF